MRDVFHLFGTFAVAYRVRSRSRVSLSNFPLDQIERITGRARRLSSSMKTVKIPDNQLFIVDSVINKCKKTFTPKISLKSKHKTYSILIWCINTSPRRRKIGVLKNDSLVRNHILKFLAPLADHVFQYPRRLSSTLSFELS